MTDTQHPAGARSAIQQALRSAARNLGWLLTGRGVLAVLSQFYLGIAARTLGVADFGRFALITGASQALATFVSFQTWQIVVQYGVGHLHERNDGALGRLLRLCFMLDFGSAMVGAVLSVLILALYGDGLGIDPELLPIVMIFSMVQLLTLRSTASGILRLRDRFALGALADSTTPSVRFIGSLLALWLSPNVAGFLYGWAAAEIATASVYWIIVARMGDLGLISRARLGQGSLREENPGIIRLTLSSNASNTLGLSNKQIPLLMVGTYAGPAGAGAFRLAFQIAQALSKLSQLLARAAFPEFVRAVRAAGPHAMRGMIGKTFWASAAGGLVILAAVAIAGETILVLVGGRAYAPAYPIMVWLAAAGCIDLATVSFEPILMAIRRAGTAFVARAAATACLLAAMISLAPLYGSVGAAAAVLIGSIVAATLLGVATWWWLRAIAPQPDVPG